MKEYEKILLMITENIIFLNTHEEKSDNMLINRSLLVDYLNALKYNIEQEYEAYKVKMTTLLNKTKSREDEIIRSQRGRNRITTNAQNMLNPHDQEISEATIARSDIEGQLNSGNLNNKKRNKLQAALNKLTKKINQIKLKMDPLKSFIPKKTIDRLRNLIRGTSNPRGGKHKKSRKRKTKLKNRNKNKKTKRKTKRKTKNISKRSKKKYKTRKKHKTTRKKKLI